MIRKVVFFMTVALLSAAPGVSEEVTPARFYVKVSQAGEIISLKDTDTIKLKRQEFTLHMPMKASLASDKTKAAYSAVIYPHPFVWDSRLLKKHHQTLLMGMATYRTGYDCMYLRNAGHYLLNVTGGRESLKKGKSLGGDWFDGTWRIDGYQFFSLGRYGEDYKELFSELDAKNKWFESKECKNIVDFPFRYLYFVAVIRSKSGPSTKNFIRFRIDFGAPRQQLKKH